MKLLNRILTGAAAVLLLAGFAPLAQAEDPLYFKNGGWLCTSPDNYREALREQANLSGRSFDELRQELLDSGKCYYIEDDQRHDGVSPYIEVLGEEGDLKNIKFVLKMEVRHALLHRDLSWYTFQGWTASDNLKPLW